MAKSKGAEIKVITKEFKVRMALYDRKRRAVSKRMLHQNGLDLEKESKNLAPIAEGTLIGSAFTSQVKERGEEMEVHVSFNAPYAAEVHETMDPAVAVHTKRPGPVTSAKPPTRFGKAGGKYLERPLIGKSLQYSKRIAKAIKKIK